MSSTMKFTSQAPLLISCTLLLASIAQQPAGSFRERAAIPFSFQQLCPPDFPMPDIWKRQCVEPIDLHAFAPAWLTSCFGWNRPLIYGPVPAEKVSWLLQKRVAATSCTRPTSGIKLSGIVARTPQSQDSIIVDGDDEPTCPPSQLNEKVNCVPEYGRKSTTE